MLISERGYERLKSPFKALFVSMKRDLRHANLHPQSTEWTLTQPSSNPESPLLKFGKNHRI